MTFLVVDSAGAPAGRDLAGAGVHAFMGYLGPRPDPKLWTAARLADYRKNGVACGFVFEGNAGDMAGGASAGAENAAIALWELAALWDGAGWGDPTGTQVGVLFADDNPEPSAGAGAYMKAAAPVLTAKGIRVGYYGNQQAAAFLMSVGVTTLGWGVSTWGVDSRGLLQLRQEANLPQLVIGGVRCDQDTALCADFGQWPRPEALAA